MEESGSKKNSSLSPDKAHQTEFLESVRVWQLKKERNIKHKKELKDQNEAKDLKFSPTLNEKSLKILKKLNEIQKTTPEVSSLTNLFSKKTSLVEQTFRPAISEKTKKLTLTRTSSVFDRLYTPTMPNKSSSKPKSSKKKYFPSYTSLIQKTYSINAGKGTISVKSPVEEIHYEPSMKFLMQEYFK